MCDMLKALYYCHNIIKVIHRDIKPENIMINHNEEAVLIDFGVCYLVDQQLNDEISGANIGTFNYYSPEMWEKKVDEHNNPISIKGELTDLWALGITFYKILTGKFPFSGTTVLKLKESILNDKIDFSLIKNGKARECLINILQKEVTKRAQLKDIINCDWVTNNGSDQLQVDIIENDFVPEFEPKTDKVIGAQPISKSST